MVGAEDFIHALQALHYLIISDSIILVYNICICMRDGANYS